MNSSHGTLHSAWPTVPCRTNGHISHGQAGSGGKRMKTSIIVEGGRRNRSLSTLVRHRLVNCSLQSQKTHESENKHVNGIEVTNLRFCVVGTVAAKKVVSKARSELSEGIHGEGKSHLMSRVESTRCVSMQACPLIAQSHHVCARFSRCRTCETRASGDEKTAEKNRKSASRAKAPQRLNCVRDLGRRRSECNTI